MAILDSGVRMLSNRMPKMITPKAHAIIDYATAAAFFGMGAYLWRKNRRAAVASLICGAAEVGTAAVTDYPGGMRPYISFEQHGKIDSIMSTGNRPPSARAADIVLATMWQGRVS